MERHPTAHRIAHVDRLSSGFDEEIGRGPQVGAVVCGRGGAVAGKVDEHHLVIGGELVTERPPAASVLGEPVGESDARAATGDPSGQRHQVNATGPESDWIAGTTGHDRPRSPALTPNRVCEAELCERPVPRPTMQPVTLAP